MAYKNKEVEREARRKYHLKNREKLIERAKRWNLNHPERVRIARLKYREKQRRLRQETEMSKRHQVAGRLGYLAKIGKYNKRDQNAFVELRKTKDFYGV